MKIIKTQDDFAFIVTGCETIEIREMAGDYNCRCHDVIICNNRMARNIMIKDDDYNKDSYSIASLLLTAIIAFLENDKDSSFDVPRFLEDFKS